MLNKFKIEFKELFFSYFFTEISHSCFSRIFVKVYIVMGSLKWHKKTSLVTLLSQWFFYTEVISSFSIFIQSYFFLIPAPDYNFFSKASSFFYFFIVPYFFTPQHQKSVFHSPLQQDRKSKYRQFVTCLTCCRVLDSLR